MSLRSGEIEIVDRNQPRCMKCGYNLRGLSSANCPECGDAPMLVVAAVTHPVSLEAAIAVLDQNEIHCDTIESRTLRSVGELVAGGGSQVTTLILVAHQEASRATHLLSSVNTGASRRPIVDVSDATCPSCGEAVDPTGESRCTSCGQRFTWVDFEETHDDCSRLSCRRCGGELTAGDCDRCPECGSPIILNAERLAAEATGESAHGPSAASREFSRIWGVMLFTLWLLLVGGGAAMAIVGSSQRGVGAQVIAAIAVILALASAVAVVYLARASNRKSR